LGDAARSLIIAQAPWAVDPDSPQPGLVAYDRDVFKHHALQVEIISLSKLGHMREAAKL
jgi:hypothetical protein